ncbi:hypothetical protein T4B_10410 [Trichinella pseudospiralis]|uniref:Uncharacterized protein n=2 Tax=Trichinella pseudospiralis TaxID=6337 RepID=A0A0V1HZ89_TRIPS|nr:hypothetical protein T4D_1905 [Trichinella pseudospiralis]KRZ15775.1 hypothetical protein T4B_10410 [Trichinella pseudospiralis]
MEQHRSNSQSTEIREVSNVKLSLKTQLEEICKSPFSERSIIIDEALLYFAELATMALLIYVRRMNNYSVFTLIFDVSH